MRKNKFYLFYLNHIQGLRLISLASFSILAVWTGAEFRSFIHSLSTENFSPRPPGVDAFLPISSLMNIRHFFSFGEVHLAHPAGFFFLLGALFVSWLFPKSFCGWVCPFGFFSEILLNLRKLIFRREFEIPVLADYFLRSLKYLILFFFVYVIFFSMDLVSLKSFLDSPYNKISDIKMYYFFVDISKFAFFIIAILVMLSFFFNFFWCRYLCPYGALMAIAGFFSFFRIKREKVYCSDCSLCSWACPHRIEPFKKEIVFSDNCSSCFLCIASCPSQKALSFGLIFSKKKLKLFLVPLLIAACFLCLKFYAIKEDLWQNKIGPLEYKRLINEISTLAHPGI